MLALYYIYLDRLEDEPQAEETLRLLEQKWGSHALVQAIHEDQQLRALRHDTAYIARMQHLLAAQDSLFAVTYDAYAHGRYGEVKSTISNVKSQMTNDNWSLAPRFLFLNAIAVARTEGQEPFVAALQELVDNYGSSELGAMAKDMLAMMGQGMESQKGGSTGDLAELRNQTEKAEAEDDTASDQEWSDDRKQPSVVVLILPTNDEQALNELQYEIALFNFSQFLIRDFELQKMPVWGEVAALRVSGFTDMDEAEWWIGLLQQNTEIQPVLQNIQINEVTEANLPLMKK